MLDEAPGFQIIDTLLDPFDYRRFAGDIGGDRLASEERGRTPRRLCQPAELVLDLFRQADRSW